MLRWAGDAVFAACVFTLSGRETVAPATPAAPAPAFAIRLIVAWGFAIGKDVDRRVRRFQRLVGDRNCRRSFFRVACWSVAFAATAIATAGITAFAATSFAVGPFGARRVLAACHWRRGLIGWFARGRLGIASRTITALGAHFLPRRRFAIRTPRATLRALAAAAAAAPAIAVCTFARFLGCLRRGQRGGGLCDNSRGRAGHGFRFRFEPAYDPPDDA